MDVHSILMIAPSPHVLDVVIDYTNHRGERRERLIRPVDERMHFTDAGHPWYPSQWVLDAIDIEKRQMRTFAMANIHNWRPVNAAPRET